VADDSSPTPRPFDVQTIKYLVQLMSRHDLSEIDLREGELRIRLLRGMQQPIALPVHATALQVAPPPAAAPGAPAAPKAAEPAAPAKKLIDIVSPTVGIFYIAPKPDAEPFVRKGSRVKADTIVGLLEAMKLFTEIPAECSGVIEEILVENQQAVEYKQVLFRVDPNG
jgi:acetyl-CoA carboxylase biotin carboxyl carrier protein